VSDLAPKTISSELLREEFQVVESQIEKLSEDLGDAYEQLTLIYRTVRHLGASFELQQIAAQLIDRALEAVPARRVALLLRTSDADFAVIASRGDVAELLEALALDSLSRMPRARFFAAGEPASPLRDGGAIRHVLAAPLDAGGNALGLLLMARDDETRFTTSDSQLVGALCSITAVAVANWQHYRAIQYEREMLDGVIREIGDGIVIADHNWLARRTNPAAAGYLGEIPNDGQYDVIERLAAFQLSVPSDDLRAMRVDGEFLARSLDPRRPLVLACKPFRASLGLESEPLLVLRMRDATREHVEAEAQRDFMSLASHKLRTPLTKILGLMPLLGSDAGEELRIEAMSGIGEGASELARLIDGVLEFVEFRRGAMPLERVDVGDLATRARDEVAERRARAREVGLTIDPTTPAIQGARRMLSSLLRHLIDNAVKFGGAGDPPEVAVAPDDGGGVRVDVVDHGDGIAPEILDRLFQPFAQRDAGFTGQEDGAGLGLLLAREVATRHGGSLDVESALSQGTRIVVRLPASAVAERDP
jgi:signal transduction histidine kinase